MATAPLTGPFPDQDWQAREALLRRFDEAWQGGTPPRIDDFLPPPGQSSARREILPELFRIDLEYRWRARLTNGRPWVVEDYLARYPELGPPEATSLELIGYEYRVRQRWGDRPGHDEYIRRFSRHGAALPETLRRIEGELAAEYAAPARRPATLVPAATISVSALLDALRGTELLNPARWEELTRSDPGTRCDDARQLARELMQRDWLTPYQANQLLQGRGHELVLGKYLVLERLGEGGAGQVFKARHRDMARTVALKVIRKELLVDPEVVARFSREMQLLGGLSHPHMIHAFDAGPVGPVHALVMEYVEGVDLGRLVREKGPLPVPQACDYIRQAALGLQYVHEKGLVHRDIKPSNLLLAKAQGSQPLGLVKILDLGLARLQEQAKGDLTSLVTPAGGVMMGTPDFMAPDQALDFHQADIRADIYSLGCTLYYLLTGAVPFPGGSVAQKVARHMQADRPWAATLRADLPAELGAVVRRMMAQRPEDRYQTPGEVASALEPFAGGGPTRGAPPLVARQRHAAWWPRVGLLSGGAALIGLLFLFLAGNPSPTPSAARNDGTVLPAEESFPGQPAELMRVLGTRRLHPWGAVRSIAFSTDGKLAASAAANEQIILWDLKTGWEKAVLKQPGKGPFTKIALSPDGKTLASLRAPDNEVLLWDVDRGEVKKTLPVKGVVQFALSPDGKMVATAADRELALWQTDTGAPVTTMKASGRVTGLTFVPDGKSLAWVEARRQIVVWEIATAQKVRSFTAPDQFGCLAFSPDGKTLAAGINKRLSELLLWDVDKQQLRTTVTVRLQFSSLAWAQDNRTIALRNQYMDSLHVWDVTPGAERELKTWSGPTSHLDPPHAQENDDQFFPRLTFTPDGQTLGWASPGALVLWDLASGKERELGRGHCRAASAVAFAPDGKTLASGGLDHAVFVWDTHLAQARHVLQREGNGIQGLAYSPDGKALAAAGRNGAVMVWDPVQGVRRHTLRSVQGSPEVVAFGRGDLLGVGSSTGEIMLWNAVTGEALAARPTHPAGAVHALAFTADGKVLASGGGGKAIVLWDAGKGAKLATLSGPEAGTCALRFSADGKALIAVGRDGILRQWDVTTEREGKPSAGLSGLTALTCVVFAPDGRTLVQGHEGGQLVLREVPSGVELGRCHLPGSARGLAISPDGLRLATANDNSTVYVLFLPLSRADRR